MATELFEVKVVSKKGMKDAPFGLSGVKNFPIRVDMEKMTPRGLGGGAGRAPREVVQLSDRFLPEASPGLSG